MQLYFHTFSADGLALNAVISAQKPQTYINTLRDGTSFYLSVAMFVIRRSAAGTI